MKRRAFVLASLVACTGGTFKREGALATAPPLPVRGELGFSAAACDGSAATAGLAADRESEATVGNMRVLVSAPHRDLANARLFGEKALGDYEAMLARLGDSATAARAATARTELARGAEIDVALADAGALAQGIRALLAFPSSTTETTSFTFAGKDEGRTVLGTCWTTMTARTFGAFDDPRFSLSCRLVTSADGATRDLHVRGHGSWANYAFRGDVSGAGDERLAFASQNVSVMGAGGVRGFDLRSTSGQIAALSFWETPRPGSRDESDPAAWRASGLSPGLADASSALLALAYVYPWPSGCDTQRLRDKGVDAGG